MLIVHHGGVDGIAILLLALAATLAIAAVMARRNGRFRAVSDSADLPGDDVESFSVEDIAGPFGERATLVQFSSDFCAPCRATKVILDDVSTSVDGVRFVEIDTVRNLDLAGRHGVMRTPTVFVLDASGRVVTRASGLPRRDQVLAAVAEAIPE